MGFSLPPTSYSMPPQQYSTPRASTSYSNSGSSQGVLGSAVVENLDQFLKSKLFGTIVEARDRQGNVQTWGTVVALTAREKGYSVAIRTSSGQLEKLKIVFETSLIGQTTESRQSDSPDLKERFSAESYLNKAIGPIMSDSSSSEDNTPTLPKDLPIDSGRGISGQRIEYLKLSENKMLEDYVVAAGNRVRLSNGFPLAIRFERE